MATELSRVERRRARTRAHLVEIAARRFAERGFEEVRLDAIAEEADVARGTLYNHFATKDALLAAILRPFLEHAAAAAQALTILAGRDAVRGLGALYLDLFERFPDALRLSHQVKDRPPGELSQLHGAFLRAVLQVLDGAARAGVLRTGNAALAARVVSRVAVPLLELYGDRPGAQALFLESFEGLLVRS
jgi:AcrR family transcriptional regulator